MGIIALAAMLVPGSFWSKQMENPRVQKAWDIKGAYMQKLSEKAGVAFPPRRLYIRALKWEQQLEVWAGPSKGPMSKLKTYEFSASSGTLGPKRKEGDLQIPEGFYTISQFNPQSKFWLSLRLDYPNASDRLLSNRDRPGGDIFIHGGNKSIGCIPITDDGISELYVLAARTVDIRGRIDVHIFPTRMTEDWEGRLLEIGAHHMAFWKQLAAAYAKFEKTREAPKVSVTKTGSYVVR